MNGRLYDARLHRFLAPDNFVQDPYNTQNYNRYGYVLNNPLQYVDLSGELSLKQFLDFVFTVVGVIIGTVVVYAIPLSSYAVGVWIAETIGNVSLGILAGTVAVTAEIYLLVKFVNWYDNFTYNLVNNIDDPNDSYSSIDDNFNIYSKYDVNNNIYHQSTTNKMKLVNALSLSLSNHKNIVKF